MKDFFVQINRAKVSGKIRELFGQDLAEEYLRQIEAHEIYVHDETSLKPYCVSVTMYPFLREGLSKLGGESQAPKHLASFCGSFINFVFAVSSQFAGAVATVEFLTYFDYFARKDFGENYLETHRKEIENHLQQVVYSINLRLHVAIKVFSGTFLSTINTTLMPCLGILFSLTLNALTGKVQLNYNAFSCVGLIKNVPKRFSLSL